MKTLKVLLLFFVFQSVCYAQITKVNFQAGGYVTGIYVAKNTGNISNQILYAKTDIGGIYKSTNNGVNWNFISNYTTIPTGNHTSLLKSELVTQGFAMNPEYSNYIIACWGGADFYDARDRDNKCVYYSTDGGDNWFESTFNVGSSNRPRFAGDVPHIKQGGECIQYKPDTENGIYPVFVAGLSASNTDVPRLFKSVDNGANFIRINSFDGSGFLSVNDTITSIAFAKGSNEIWIAFTHKTSGNNFGGVLRGIPNGSGGYNFTKFDLPCARRVILKKVHLGGNDYKLVVFIAYAGGGSTSTGLYKIEVNEYASGTISEGDITSSYFTNYGYSSNNMCLLSFAGSDENTLLAGRVLRPTMKSTNDGASFVGETSGNPNDPIRLYFDPNTQNTSYPRHQFPISTVTHLESGISMIVRNYNSSMTNTWYVTGGAGMIQTINNDAPTSSTLFGNKKFAYTTVGMNFPVLYDVSVNYKHFSNMYFPMSDWTMGNVGQKRAMSYSASPLEYDRQETKFGNQYDTKIPNVRRILHSTINSQPNVSYCIGGNVYDNSAFMYKRTANIYGEPSSVSQIGGTYSPFIATNRSFPDGIIDYDFNTNNDRLIVLLGPSSGKSTPNITSGLGVYRSVNGGLNWSPCSFYNAEEEDNITNNMFMNAIISAGNTFGENGYISGLFENQFNLSNSATPGEKYLYLEGFGSGTQEGGGFFMSPNYGESWEFQSNVVGNPSGDDKFKGEGCLKYADWATGPDQLFIAIKQTPDQLTNNWKRGLYSTDYDGFNTGNSWTRHSFFSSARQVDAISDKLGRKVICVYGKRDGVDAADRLYVSYDGGANFSVITDMDYVTGISSLRISRDCTPLSVWVATSDMGAFNVRLYQPYYQYACLFPIAADLVINGNMEFESDIIITDSATVTIDGNVEIKMPQDAKIIVDETAKLIVTNGSNVTFTKDDAATSWNGIEFRGSANGHLKKCTFENTSSPIRIVASDSGSVAIVDTLIIDSCTFNSGENQITIESDSITASRNIRITNNTFNLPSGGQKCIYAENVFNLLVKNNTFNIGTGSFGIHTKNSFGVDPFSEAPPTYVNIVGNTFYGGTIGMALMNSELLTYYVAENIFAGSANGYYGIITKKVNGRIKNNLFNNTNINQALRIDLSDVSLFNNAINGNEDNINVLALSTVNMSPIINGEDFVWEGGANWVTSNNANNLAFNGAGLPLLDYGKNCFNLISSTNGNHLLGVSSITDNTYMCRNNGWTHVTPERLSNIHYNSTPIVPALDPTYNCSTTPSYDGYNIANRGNGIYDTIWTSETGTLSEQDDDEIMYNQALYYQYSYDYVNAIYVNKNLIDNYLSSSYLIDAIWNLNACYGSLDTGSVNHDNLYSELKIYMTNLISSENYDEGVESAAYQVILECEAQLGDYNKAMDGYEFLVEYHPDPVIRLNASWDYEDLAELLGGGSSVKEEQLSFEEYKLKRLFRMDKIVSGDPILQKLKAKYDDKIVNKYNTAEKIVLAKKDITANDRSTIEKKIYTEQQQTIMQRSLDNIRNARLRTKAEKDKKLVEDLILSGGMSLVSDNSGNTTVPMEYKLQQNYPNPFNPVTTIKYQLPKDGLVQIKVYDIIGREVMTLANEQKTAGTYEAVFNGLNFASGIYFYRIQAGNFVETKKMMLIK
ncbi:MAG TPA: T9SS type A sorting domain-containing protein [Ignavibacteria bacterium]|nr:T9SS type A sorting domain-containing protein [Ignavibacteria bacterium]